VGFTRDLWTRPEKQPDGKVKRVPNARWGHGKRWLACWLDPDEQERTKAFTNKEPANKYWRDMESARDRGEYHDPKVGRELFSSIAKRWLASRSVDPTSEIKYESAYRIHVEPVFGRRQVKSIKPSEIQEFQTGLEKKFSKSTVSIARRVIVGVLNLADADELIKKNPALSHVVQRMSPKDPEQVVAWGEERVFAIIDAHPEHLKMLPSLAFTCGHREGEAFAVALEDIDYDRGVIHVRRQVKKLGSKFVFALPKNDRSRIIPLPNWTAEGLRAHVKRFPPITVTLPWERPTGELRTHQLVFGWKDGGIVKARGYSEQVWKPALSAAKVIPAPTKGRRGAPQYQTTRKEGTHQLRHAYASVMLAEGVSIKDLAEYLGHGDPGFTLRRYVHMLPDSHERARNAIDNRLFRPRAVADGT
jgi:integrase